MRWKVLGAVVFAVVIVVFTLANSSDVSVNFVFARERVNLVLVILLSVLLGMVLMAILWSIHAWRLRGEIRARNRHIAELEAKVQSMEAERAASAREVGQGPGAHGAAEANPPQSPDSAW
ncbi:LapA family protein [Alicyclobacillus vulcanalis]|uniref:Uncharacterized integral membrane protein n=1 Tax=Alicyclobacillus vulcanalis TaxID=252246 RepID=A0A1N7N485_9BACL|nr:LapA family protein [Alicyclobacillus vulcanalis]SIS93166.1 Uncharacterized integral membrane protein [Alicyclobacillus vulcanalis]